jgi:protein subunit release factor A
MKLVIEIKAGEGGKNAQLLVPRQASIYSAYAEQNGLICRHLDSGLG